MRARGVRDAAMGTLLYVGGLRETKLASLRLSDYDPQARTLRFRGKGNKERRVYAEGGADLLLSAWLGLRGEGEPEEPLFLPVRKDGKIQHLDLHGEKKASLSDQSVYQVVKRRHREAKIREVSPHDFRKTFVGDLLDAIGDLSRVQKLAGHSDPATTARYDRRGEWAMREAASHLHVPHFGD
jgi:site-specific recombinase XerD